MLPMEQQANKGMNTPFLSQLNVLLVKITLQI